MLERTGGVGCGPALNGDFLGDLERRLFSDGDFASFERELAQPAAVVQSKGGAAGHRGGRPRRGACPLSYNKFRECPHFLTLLELF